MFILDIFAAIATVVTVAEILKNNGLAVEKSKISYLPFVIHISVKLSRFDIYSYLHALFAEITTSTVEMKDETRARPVQKAKVNGYKFVCACFRLLHCLPHKSM